MKSVFKMSILNALVIAGIVFVSTLSIDYPPSGGNIWAAVIGGSMAFLTQLKTVVQDELKGTDTQHKIGMII